MKKIKRRKKVTKTQELKGIHSPQFRLLMIVLVLVAVLVSLFAKHEIGVKEVIELSYISAEAIRTTSELLVG